jgi:hypothetical protein
MRKLTVFILVIIICASCGIGNATSPPEALAFSSRARMYDAASQSGVTAVAGEVSAAALSVGMENFVSADDAVADEIYKRAGVKLIPINIRSDDYEQMARLSASDTLPDLLRINITSPFFARLIDEGKLRDWTPAYPSLEETMNGSVALAAVTRLHGKAYFMPLADEPEADPGRIYYRKDWLAETGLPEPATTDEYAAMLKAFQESKGKPGLTLAGGVTYLVSMFGPDPYSWIYENGEWIPAYYSNKMTAGLQYARALYAGGWLDYEYTITKANTAVGKYASGEAGSLIRHGDSLWFERVLSAFGGNYEMNIKEAYDGYVGVLPPLAAPAAETADASGADANSEALTTHADVPGTAPPSARWPRRLPNDGIVMPSSASDAQMRHAQALLDFILSDDAEIIASYGIKDETGALSADGTPRLFIDPATAKPFNITERYPAARVLQLLGEPPHTLPAGLEAGMQLTDAKYEAAVPVVDDGYLAHFIHNARRSSFEGKINMGAAFNAIVIGDADVAEMFAAFRALCDESGIRAVIDEVNAVIAAANG